MKFTRWADGLWSLTALLLLAGNADAWLFNHCHSCSGVGGGFQPLHPFRCCHAFETHICVRPYNAFTPICWGNLYCDGCNPNPQGVASGCCIPTPWAGCMPGSLCASSPWGPPPGLAGGAPYPQYPMYGDPNQFNPYQGMLPSVPTSMPLPPGAFPPGSLPPGAVPMAPTNNVPPVLNHTAQYPYPGMYYGMQPTNNFGYYPVGYYPGYNPYYYYGQPQR